jgi:hypothetical protein
MTPRRRAKASAELTAEVKAAAEDAILMGNRRIAEELAKVPKASGRPTWQAAWKSHVGEIHRTHRDRRASHDTMAHRQARRQIVRRDQGCGDQTAGAGQGRDAECRPVLQERFRDPATDEAPCALSCFMSRYLRY